MPSKMMPKVGASSFHVAHGLDVPHRVKVRHGCQDSQGTALRSAHKALAAKAAAQLGQPN